MSDLEDIARGDCPLCGRNFRWVSMHLVKGHGVDLVIYRDSLGLPRGSSMISSDLRDAMARRAIARDQASIARTGNQPKTHTLGVYGRQSQRAKAIASGSQARVKGAATWKARDPIGYVQTHRANLRGGK